MSAQLRKSVAGFRLPDYGGGTTTVGAASSARVPALNEPASTGGTVGAGSSASNTGNTGTGTTGNTGTGNTGTGNTGNTGKMRKASGFGA